MRSKRPLSNSSRGHYPTRRDFLKQTGATLLAGSSFAQIVHAAVLGKNGFTPPSERITVGFIGVGKMGKGHVGSFLEDKTVQIVAICDVERGRRESQVKRVEEHYAEQRRAGTYRGCASYVHFVEMLTQEKMDGVVIVTPPHWHALMCCEAARAGCDIYCEKPLTRCIDEGKAIIRSVRCFGRVFQTGSQQRSDEAFRRACEIVRNGRIGEIKEIFVNVGGPPQEDDLPPEPTPEGLDWDLWLGPCMYRPYSSVLAPPESYEGWPRFRYYRDYDGGGMTDFGAHHFDIAQWGIGTDDTGPVEIYPPDGKEFKTLTYVYANGIRMYHGGGHPAAAVEFVGTRGRVRVNRGQYLETEPAYLKDDPIGADEVHLYRSNNHKDNWLQCMRTRRDPICTAEIGHRTATICHIGNIAYWLKRPLKWDPVREEFVGDPAANRLRMRAFRSPWQLPV